VPVVVPCATLSVTPSKPGPSNANHYHHDAGRQARDAPIARGTNRQECNSATPPIANAAEVQDDRRTGRRKYHADDN
jgi:hypothetical protein